MKHFVLSLIVSFFLTLPAFALPTGTTMPDASFTGSDGETHSLKDYTGKIVVLEWHNPGCPFVGKFYNSGTMQKLQAAATADGVIWITINSGAVGKEGYLADDQAAQQYMADKKMAATLYVRDVDGKLGQLFGAKTTPHMFVINKDGKLAYQGAIDDKPSANQADLVTAHNYVSAALVALAAGQPVKTATTPAYGCSVKY